MELREDKNMKNKRRKDQGTMSERYIKSFHHAVDGIVYAIEKEGNLILMMAFILAILALCFFFPVNASELLAIVISTGLLMASEMINTSIEALTDLVTTSENKLAKIAKDTASSAVLIFIVMFLTVLGIVFIPKIVALF